MIIQKTGTKLRNMNNVLVENAEELLSHNKEYEKTLYDIKEENPGIKKSNFGGGWHSEDITNLESFASLKLYIECIVERKKILDNFKFHSMWGNINPPGAWNENHHHSGLALSGCYYIKTNTSCGDLLIEIDDDYLTPPETCSFIPEDGMMLLFSSEYYHSVNKNLSKEDRISIAFNLS